MYFWNKFNDIQHENDDLTEHIKSLRNMNNHNVKMKDKNMNKIKEEMWKCTATRPHSKSHVIEFYYIYIL